MSAFGPKRTSLVAPHIRGVERTAEEQNSSTQGFLAFFSFEKRVCVNGCVNKRGKINGTDLQTNGMGRQPMSRHARLMCQRWDEMKTSSLNTRSSSLSSISARSSSKPWSI